MSPYSLAWEDENYYCIGYYEKYNAISNFRVDRMEDVEVSGEPAVPAKDFNLAEYTRRIFGMFAGSETVRASSASTTRLQALSWISSART